MTVFLVLSVNTLAGVQSKVGTLVRDVVGSGEADPLAAPQAPLQGNGSGSYAAPPPFVPFKGTSHVE
jgi:hypothetical protein